MLNIGDFARLVGVSVRMLRHYDHLGLLRPAEVDEFSGYRRYSAVQLARANRLVALKDLGFSLEQVKTMLAGELGAEELRGMLRMRQAQLSTQIAEDAARLQLVEARLRMIEKETHMSTLEFTEKSLPALHLAQLSMTVNEQQEIGPAIGPMFQRIAGLSAEQGIRPTGPVVGHYTVTDAGTVIAAATQVAPGVTVEGTESADLDAAPRALTVIHTDDIATIGHTWQALAQELEHRGMQPAGTCREIYYETPLDPGGTQWVVELQQPVE